MGVVVVSVSVFGKLNDGWLLVVYFIGVKSEVLVMEDFVLVLDDLDGWDGEVLLVDLNVDGGVGYDEWDVLVDGVLLDLVDGALFGVGDFIRDLDLGAVWNLVFDNVGNLDLNLVWALVVDGHWDFPVDVVGLLFVLGDLNLLGDDVWDLLDDGVVHADGGLIRHLNVFFVRDLVDHGVWNDVGDNIWDAVEDRVWLLAAGDV